MDKFNDFVYLEEMEQFLFCCGLRDDLILQLKSKGIRSIDNLIELVDNSLNSIKLPKNKLNQLVDNIEVIKELYKSYFNNQNEENNESLFEILRKTFFIFQGIDLTSELIINGFKIKNKPQISLPKALKNENLTSDKIYASYLNDKKIINLNFVEGFKNLKSLYLANNFIQKIEKMNFPNLTILELGNNLIKKIENLETLPNLESLNLEKNLINKFENLYLNEKLKSINLGKQNLVKCFEFKIDLETLPIENEIESLNLEDCCLSDPSALCIFTRLNKIKLNNNKIKDLSNIITMLNEMTDLEYLFIQNNPFIEQNKNYRDLIVLKCPTLKELDNKNITANEKSYINTLYKRKFMKQTSIKQNKQNFNDYPNEHNAMDIQTMKDWGDVSNLKNKQLYKNNKY